LEEENKYKMPEISKEQRQQICEKANKKLAKYWITFNKIDIQEFAKLQNVSVRTIYKWNEKYKFDAINKGIVDMKLFDLNQIKKRKINDKE